MLYVFAALLVSFANAQDCVSSLVDLPGNRWRDAGTQPISARLKKHTVAINKVTVHYTGVKKNPNLPIERKLKGLFNFSATGKTEFKKELWGDIPYNYYIDMDGKAAEGRSPDFMPDTNTKYSPDGHVTIVVEGDPTDDISGPQKDKLFKMVKALQDKYNIPPAGVNVHNHYATTSCPGPAVGAAMQEYRSRNGSYRPDRQRCVGAAGAPAGSAPRPPPKKAPAQPKSSSEFMDSIR